MNDILDHDPGFGNGEINENNLLIKIWTKPRATFRYILDNCPDKYFYVLMGLAGVFRGLERFMDNETRGEYFFAYLIGALVLGAGFGWISYWIYGAMISWTGKWLGGDASTKDILPVVAWSMLPMIITIPVTIIIILGFETFPLDNFDLNGPLIDQLIFAGLLSFYIITFILSVRLFTIGVSEVQDFKNGRALLNVSLPVLLLLIVILLFSGILILINGGLRLI